MLDKNGALKIIDYGLAKDIRELNSQNTSTQTEFSFKYEGTPDYMAPELHGCQKYNPYKADVFSYGLIILELGIMEKMKHEDSIKFEENVKIQLKKMKKIYQNEDKKKLKKMSKTIKKCLLLDVDSRLDFIDIFRGNIGNCKEGKEKIKFYIKLEQMGVDECHLLFGKDDEINLKKEVTNLGPENATQLR